RFKPATGGMGELAEPLFAQLPEGFGSHSFSKRSMIAIPLARAVKRLQKEISTLNGLQEDRTLLLTSHSCTEGGTQARQHTGTQQKVLEFFRLHVKHFGHEIASNGAMTTTKRRKQVFDLLLRDFLL